MAYIQPTSEVWLCSNVPLDPSYDNTLTFTTTVNNRKVWDSAAQRAYFASKAVYHPQNFSIVKERDGVLRMSGEVSKFYNINYMFFINPTFETSQLYSGKYFYAFVTQVEEVNPNTTFIYFELDYYQTWAAEIEFMESVIEREHVSDDSMYKNLEDEGINIQDTMPYEKVYLDKVLGQKILVVGATESYEQLLANAQTKGIDIYYDPVYVHYPLLEKYGSASSYDVQTRVSTYNINSLVLFNNGSQLSYSSFSYDGDTNLINIKGIEDISISEIRFTLTVNYEGAIPGIKHLCNFYVKGINTGGDWTFGIDGIRIDYDPWTNYPNRTGGSNLDSKFAMSAIKNGNTTLTTFYKSSYFYWDAYVGASPNRIIISNVSLTGGTNQIDTVIFRITLSDGITYIVKGTYSGGSWTFADGS